MIKHCMFYLWDGNGIISAPECPHTTLNSLQPLARAGVVIAAN
jgi:hypothetical protein